MWALIFTVVLLIAVWLMLEWRWAADWCDNEEVEEGKE